MGWARLGDVWEDKIGYFGWDKIGYFAAGGCFA